MTLRFPVMRIRTVQQGFTLLELLVTLVVLGLLMVTLTEGLRIGLQAWALEGRIGGRASGLETADRALRQLIGQAWPGEPRSQDDGFTGTPHAVSFTTTLPEGLGAPFTHQAKVTLMVAAGHRLELQWSPHYRRWIVQPPPPSAVVLLDGVQQLDLGFWQPALPPQQGRWLTVWTSPTLPPLVRVRIVFPPGDARHWPDIVVATMQQRPAS
jgi:general secretion pathway protein J